MHHVVVWLHTLSMDQLVAVVERIEDVLADREVEMRERLRTRRDLLNAQLSQAAGSSSEPPSGLRNPQQSAHASSEDRWEFLDPQ